MVLLCEHVAAPGGLFPNYRHAFRNNILYIFFKLHLQNFLEHAKKEKKKLTTSNILSFNVNFFVFPLNFNHDEIYSNDDINENRGRKQSQNKKSSKTVLYLTFLSILFNLVLMQK